jgi:hypothetical protein
VTIHEYLMKSMQDDARRAGERDRLLLEARRARSPRRQRPVLTAPARRRTELGKIILRENAALDGVIQHPAGGEALSLGGWASLIRNSPQLVRLVFDEARGVVPFRPPKLPVARRAVAIPQRPTGRQINDGVRRRWPFRNG